MNNSEHLNCMPLGPHLPLLVLASGLILEGFREEGERFGSKTKLADTVYSIVEVDVPR